MKKLRCPKCKSCDYIDIVALVSVRLVQADKDFWTDADESRDGSHAWEGNSHASCRDGCGWSGLVKDLTNYSEQEWP